MKARALIANATFGPEELEIVGKAFDDAWKQIAPQVGTRPDAIEAARYRLATFVLALADEARGHPLDAEPLTDGAIQMMHANITKLGK